MCNPFLLLALFLQSANPSPVPGVVLILSVIGAIADWRYKRKGGNKSSKRERIMFLIALLLVVALFTVLTALGASAGGIGHVLPLFAIILFGTWELGRWRARRKFPLSPPEKTT
jgi:cytochrome c biogenesis protein CcdA